MVFDAFALVRLQRSLGRWIDVYYLKIPLFEPEIMISSPPTMAIPLRTDQDGVIRVCNTRVTFSCFKMCEK